MKPITEMTNSELYDLNIDYTPNPFENQPQDLKSVLTNKKVYSDKNLTVNYDEIYIGNLDTYLNYEDLNDFLSRFGQIEYINMQFDKQRGKKFLGNH